MEKTKSQKLQYLQFIVTQIADKLSQFNWHSAEDINNMAKSLKKAVKESK